MPETPEAERNLTPAPQQAPALGMTVDDMSEQMLGYLGKSLLWMGIGFAVAGLLLGGLILSVGIALWVMAFPILLMLLGFAFIGISRFYAGQAKKRNNSSSTPS